MGAESHPGLGLYWARGWACVLCLGGSCLWKQVLGRQVLGFTPEVAAGLSGSLWGLSSSLACGRTSSLCLSLPGIALGLRGAGLRLPEAPGGPERGAGLAQRRCCSRHLDWARSASHAPAGPVATPWRVPAGNCFQRNFQEGPGAFSKAWEMVRESPPGRAPKDSVTWRRCHSGEAGAEPCADSRAAPPRAMPRPPAGAELQALSQVWTPPCVHCEPPASGPVSGPLAMVGLWPSLEMEGNTQFL